MPTKQKSPPVEPVAASNTIDTPVGRLDYFTLAQWRTIRGLSQSELARKVEMSQGSIWQLEAGNTVASIHTATKIARALNVMIDQIAWTSRPQKRPARKPTSREEVAAKRTPTSQSPKGATS